MKDKRERQTKWYLPKGHKPSKDKSKKYIVSEIQLRKLFCMRFNPLDFNRDFVKEFIEQNDLAALDREDIFPYCAKNCEVIKELGAGECENVCPIKFKDSPIKDKEAL